MRRFAPVLALWLTPQLVVGPVFAQGAPSFNAPGPSAPSLSGIGLDASVGSSSSPSDFGDGATAFARDLGAGGSNDSGGGDGGISRSATRSLRPGGAEYVSGYYPGAVMIPVNLMGAVSKAGVHSIPTRTNLLRLISLAGGINRSAELDNVTIKRLQPDPKDKSVFREEIIKVDIESLLTKPGSRGPELRQDDLIYIPPREPWISNNTMLTLGFVSSLLGIVVSAVVISNQNSK